MMIDRHWKCQQVKATEKKTGADFAECKCDLVDVYYPSATLIGVVLDSLSTHTPAAFYQAISPAEARRILRRIGPHHTPKRADTPQRKRGCLRRTTGTPPTAPAQKVAEVVTDWETEEPVEVLDPPTLPVALAVWAPPVPHIVMLFEAVYQFVAVELPLSLEVEDPLTRVELRLAWSEPTML